MSLAEASTADWDGLVVLCAANGYDGVRMSDWHLAGQLSRLAPVLTSTRPFPA